MIHRWIVEYADAKGFVKQGNAHTKAGAERLAADLLRQKAQWAIYRRQATGADK